jgi:hypothetical protein
MKILLSISRLLSYFGALFLLYGHGFNVFSLPSWWIVVPFLKPTLFTTLNLSVPREVQYLAADRGLRDNFPGRSALSVLASFSE